MAAQRDREVVWTDSATRDLEEIITFVAEESHATAEHLLTKLQGKAGSLARHSFRGRVVPELLRFGMKTWRELIVHPYRVVYRVAGTTVFVLAVFDSRRDLEDLLLERLLRDPHA